MKTKTALLILMITLLLPACTGGTPPQAAIAACAGKNEQAACEFTSPKGTETGICETVQAQLACSPQRGLPGGNKPEAGRAAPSAVDTPSRTVSNSAPKSTPNFVLTSPIVAEGGDLPAEYTCDGNSATLPLEWSDAPAKTKSFAVIMHHIAGPEDIHWYWVVYNIPANVTGLPKNSTGVGALGNNSVNGRTEYAPPCSKGPGPKTYTYTVYALSAQPRFSVPAAQVNREVLLNAIQDITLASAELHVTYSRK